MFTKSHIWQRWSGPLTDVTAALNLAMLELEQWSGIPTTATIRIAYSNHLTHSGEDPTMLEHLHITDVRLIKDLSIDVELDSHWWQDQSRQYHRQRIEGPGEGALVVKPPPFNYAAVKFRLSKSFPAGPMRLVVQGPDRTSVEGLTTRLVEVLHRSTSGPTKGFPDKVGWAFVPLVAFLGFAAGDSAVGVFNLGGVVGHYELPRVVLPIAAAIVAGTFWAAFVWALPSLELLDSTERSRFQRYQGLLLSGVGAVVAGLIATAIWAAIT